MAGSACMQLPNFWLDLPVAVRASIGHAVASTYKCRKRLFEVQYIVCLRALLNRIEASMVSCSSVMLGLLLLVGLSSCTCCTQVLAEAQSQHTQSAALPGSTQQPHDTLPRTLAHRQSADLWAAAHQANMQQGSSVARQRQQLGHAGSSHCSSPVG